MYAPFLNEMFAGARGCGATLNGAPIAASGETNLKKALVATGFPYNRDNVSAFFTQFKAVITHCRDIRRLGSAALDICMVASGRLEGFYETINPWDIAAACLIAREAGALTGHIHPRPTDAILPPDLYADELVAGAPHIFDPLRSLLLAATDEAAGNGA